MSRPSETAGTVDDAPEPEPDLASGPSPSVGSEERRVGQHSSTILVSGWLLQSRSWAAPRAALG